MRLRAVYAFVPPVNPYGRAWGANGQHYNSSPQPTTTITQYVSLSGYTEQRIRDLGLHGTSLVWGHVVEVQETEAIFITTLGQLERVPLQYLVLIDFIEPTV